MSEPSTPTSWRACSRCNYTMHTQPLLTQFVCSHCGDVQVEDNRTPPQPSASLSGEGHLERRRLIAERPRESDDDIVEWLEMIELGGYRRSIRIAMATAIEAIPQLTALQAENARLHDLAAGVIDAFERHTRGLPGQATTQHNVVALVNAVLDVDVKRLMAVQDERNTFHQRAEQAETRVRVLEVLLRRWLAPLDGGASVNLPIDETRVALTGEPSHG